jgi:hypothetical protein
MQGSVGVAAMAIFDRLGIKEQVQPKLKILGFFADCAAKKWPCGQT